MNRAKDVVGHAWRLVMRPLTFLILAVVLMIIVIKYEVSGYPEYHETIDEVVSSSLAMGAVFLIVAGISAVAAVLTRNAPLHWLMVVVLSLLLALGVFWMTFLFSMGV